MRARRGIAGAAVVAGLLAGIGGCGVRSEEAPRPLDTATTAPPLPVPPVRQLPAPPTPCPTPTTPPTVPTTVPTAVPSAPATGSDGARC